MKFLQLRRLEDIGKIELGTNIRILDETADSGRGFFSTCIEKKGGVYVFAGTPGVFHLPEVRDESTKPEEYLVKVALKKEEGHVTRNSWFFDGTREGVVQRIKKDNSEFKLYYEATKDIVDFLRQQDRTWFYLGWMEK